MQGGVIGGICLLACLLSLSQAEESGDPKQVEESETTEQKVTEPSVNEDGRRSYVGLKSIRVAPDDLKGDVNGSISTLLEEIQKSSSEIQNVSQSLGDPSSSMESSNNRSSLDSLGFPGVGSPQSRQFIPESAPENSGSGSYFLDSRITNEQGLPDESGANSSGNIAYNNIPAISQGFTAGSDPSPSSIPNIQYFEVNRKPIVEFTTSASTAEKILDTTSPKSAERTIFLNTNKVPNAHTLDNPFEYNNAKVTPSKEVFSPLFSNTPQSELSEPLLLRANNQGAPYISNVNQYSPIPQPYSYDTKAAFDQSRLKLAKDENQVRTAEENQYSETMNSYPFVSVSSRSDSSSSESVELRSGAPYTPSYPSYQNSESSAQAYAQAQSSNDVLTNHNQGLNPYSYGYPPGSPDIQASASAQTSSNVPSAQSSGAVIEDGKSRVIMPHEYIFPHKMRGGENVIQCTRENELHHFWAPGFDCLVCICLNEYGLLEPVCASCSGCQNPAPPEPPPRVPDQSHPTPEPYAPVPVPDPYVPLPVPNLEPYTPSASAPSLILEPAVERDLELTTPPSMREVPVSCNPLPSGHPFPHPLSPCQLCICKESITALGKIDVRIECQDSPHCVVPPELSTLPPIPDIPVPVPHGICEDCSRRTLLMPLCEKFPSQVSFPHPKEKCKLCKCSVELSATGVPEQQITCFGDGDCGTGPKTEPTQLGVTPPAPPIPIPVEPYPGPFPEPVVEPVPEHFPPVPTPNAVTPGEPLPWPPISTSPPPPTPLLPPRRVPGPLPGPSPHESCRPYPPNQPFQHPWDDCQVCECTESKAVGMVNVEISCYTKLSCCIESPEQVISAIAGKSNSEASSGPNSEENQVKGLLNPQTSTLKPSGYAAFNPVRQNKAYAEANAIVQSALNDPAYQSPYQSASAISNAVSGSQNQGYSEANAIAQSSLNSPYLSPGSYPTANAYGSAVNGGGQSSAEASAESLAGTNNIPGSFGSYNPGMVQSQAYAEANAIAQKGLINPAYQVPGPYQSIKPVASVPAVGLTSAEASEEYVPGTVTNKPPSAYPQYNPGASPNQAFAEANAQYNRPISSTYKPSALYAQYNPEVSPNQAYAEAVAQYNELNLLTNTQKPPALYGQYNSGISGANGQYSIVSSTFKPPALYSQYNPETYQNQNQAYGQANGQYNIVSSTQRPAALYGQAYPSPNAVYKGVPPNQAYAGANAQSTLANPGYYLSGPYQGKALGTASALGTVNGDQSSAIAEAIAQTQDYSPYLQSGPNPSSGYQYPANYYAGYMNPQYASYQGLEGYKQSPVKYAGNYEFNGQADGMGVLGAQNGYYPYGAGYSQGIPGSNMYSSLYPTQTGYEINPMYRPGQYGGSNAQASAQAFANTKMQTKSGEGLQEDSDDSK